MFILAAEARPVRLSGFEMTVTFMVTVVAIIEVEPAAVAVISAVGVLGSLGDGPRPPIKLIFNSSQNTLAGGTAALAYGALGGGPVISPDQLPALLLATGTATAVYFLVNTAAVAGVLSISDRRPLLQTWRTSFGWTVATYAAFGAFGIVLAGLYQLVNVFVLPLLVVPLLVLRSVFGSYREVSEAYDSTVRAFVAAIEAKDSYTRGHSERVALYSTMIARRLGMREEEVTVFRYGALLHDVGKLVIRRAVLTKPGRLDESEYEEIKRHPVVGAQIVQEIEFLRPALDGVLYHHERLDGSGYPAGLAGPLVPQGARIMAVADVFDAMTSTRAYRGARTKDEAIAELHRCSGAQLDETCVGLLVGALAEEGVEIPQERVREAQAVAGVAG